MYIQNLRRTITQEVYNFGAYDAKTGKVIGVGQVVGFFRSQRAAVRQFCKETGRAPQNLIVTSTGHFTGFYTLPVKVFLEHASLVRVIHDDRAEAKEQKPETRKGGKKK